MHVETLLEEIWMLRMTVNLGAPMVLHLERMLDVQVSFMSHIEIQSTSRTRVNKITRRHPSRREHQRNLEVCGSTEPHNTTDIDFELALDTNGDACLGVVITFDNRLHLNARLVAMMGPTLAFRVLDRVFAQVYIEIDTSIHVFTGPLGELIE